MTDHILNHWTQQAKKYKSGYEASWQDIYAIRLEVETIGRNIHPGDRVLDVGCGNGYSTVRQLERKPSAIVGVDYCEEMVRAANRAHRRRQGAAFFHGDVRDLPFDNSSFDVVYTTRTLINLPTWDEQQRGIDECLRVCRRTVVLTEAFWEPLVRLNAMRCLAGLSPLVEHDFNRYLKTKVLDGLLSRKRLRWSRDDFSSVYYFGTRVLRELVDTEAQFTAYDNAFNRKFYELERKHSGGKCGIQQAYIIEKG